jgi:hypothetical protein
MVDLRVLVVKVTFKNGLAFGHLSQSLEHVAALSGRIAARKSTIVVETWQELLKSPVCMAQHGLLINQPAP